MAYFARAGAGSGAVTAARGTFAGGPTQPPPVFLRANAPVLSDQINRLYTDVSLRIVRRRAPARRRGTTAAARSSRRSRRSC